MKIIKNYKIALVVPTLDTSYFIDIIESAIQESENYKNVHLIVQVPEKNSNTIERQIQIIEDLIEQEIDLLCLIPADSRSLIPTIKRINKANVPVFIIDNPLDTNLSKLENIKIETYIGSDNYLGGKMAAEFISKKYKKGNLLILEGKFGTNAAIDRKRGFVDNLTKNIKIIDSIPAYWDKESANYIIKKFFEKNNIKLDYIFASNDEMALGAVTACEELNKNIKIIGFDGIDQAIDSINNNKMIATILQSTDEMGKKILIKSIEYLEGKKIPKKIYTKLKLIQKKDLHKSF